MTEAHITINGRVLNEAQSLAVRVACCHLQAQMTEDGALGGDETGKEIARAYRDRMSEVITMIMMKEKDN